MLVNELRIKVQEKCLFSPLLHGIISPNFGFPVKKYSVVVDGSLLEVTSDNLHVLIKACRKEKECYIFASNNYSRKLVIEKHLGSWFIFLGCSSWFTSSPVSGDVCRMVSELNAVKMLEFSFSNDNKLVDVWEEATKICVHDSDFGLCSDDFIAQQVNLLSS